MIKIEGNVYFPPSSIKKDYFKNSDYSTTCPWKGLASYYHIEVNGRLNENAAWYYKIPKEGSTEVVASQNNGLGNFADHVAFWKGVEVLALT